MNVICVLRCRRHALAFGLGAEADAGNAVIHGSLERYGGDTKEALRATALLSPAREMEEEALSLIFKGPAWDFCSQRQCSLREGNERRGTTTN